MVLWTCTRRNTWGIASKVTEDEPIYENGVLVGTRTKIKSDILDDKVYIQKLMDRLDHAADLLDEKNERIQKLEDCLRGIHRRAKRNRNTRAYGLASFCEKIHKNCKKLKLYEDPDA